MPNASAVSLPSATVVAMASDGLFGRVWGGEQSIPTVGETIVTVWCKSRGILLRGQEGANARLGTRARILSCSLHLAIKLTSNPLTSIPSCQTSTYMKSTVRETTTNIHHYRYTQAAHASRAHACFLESSEHTDITLSLIAGGFVVSATSHPHGDSHPGP